MTERLKAQISTEFLTVNNPFWFLNCYIINSIFISHPRLNYFLILQGLKAHKHSGRKEIPWKSLKTWQYENQGIPSKEEITIEPRYRVTHSMKDFSLDWLFFVIICGDTRRNLGLVNRFFSSLTLQIMSWIFMLFSCCCWRRRAADMILFFFCAHT